VMRTATKPLALLVEMSCSCDEGSVLNLWHRGDNELRADSSRVSAKLWWRNCTSFVKEAKTGNVKSDQAKCHKIKCDEVTSYVDEFFASRKGNDVKSGC
jgi:hypothetical protein